MLMAAVPVVATAATIGMHSGKTDPTTEGFTAVANFTNVVRGAVSNDLGLDAWQVDDNGSGLGWYSFALTPAQLVNAATYGWKLSTRLRVVDVPDSSSSQIGADASPFVSYRTGSTTYQIHFGSESDGDPFVHVAAAFPSTPVAGNLFTLQNGGSGYHLYELLHTPVGGLDLFIDGTERLSNLTAASLTVAQPAFLFGAGSSSAMGHGNFNLVKFETFEPMPVPAALPMFAAVVAGLGWAASRRTSARTDPPPRGP